MAKKTSIHICAAKYGAEKHNRREKAMKHVHSEYSHLNKSWEASDFKSVADEIRKAKERYSQKHFCRKVIIDQNGNKVWSIDPSKPKKMPKNSEPIREGVAVITEATTMEQMQQLAQQIEQRWGIKTRGIWAHLDEGHEHLVTDKDHQKGKYLDTSEGSTIFLWNYHAHYLFDWTNHETGQCINLNRHDMSELQDMLANTFKMERGKKSDKKWRDAHTFKAEQEKLLAKEAAEYVERKKSESKALSKAIEDGSRKLAKLQKAIDELMSTCIQEEDLNAVPFADMAFKLEGSDKTITVKDLVDDALRRINDDVSTPIPMFGRDEWQKERNAKAKVIVTTLQQQLLSVSKLHRHHISKVGKQLYIVAKQRVVMALETEKENMRLKQRISELDDKAVVREKNRADNAERKVQELSQRVTQNEQKASQAEAKVSNMEAFIRLSGFSKAYEHWILLNQLIDEAICAFNKWAHSTASIFSRDDERVIGKGIIAKCQMENLEPSVECNRLTAAKSIADMAESTIGSITKFRWDIAVTRIGQLVSEMNVSMGGQSLGGSNGNADELTNWDGTKKRGLGR
jgi:hypothetical protein